MRTENKQEKLDEINQWIIDRDNDGSFWPPKSLQELYLRSNMDSRYSYLSKLPRSAFFGQLITTEYEYQRYGVRTKESRELGILLNLFVTFFDSVCDIINEELPYLLRHLTPIMHDFPNENDIHFVGDPKFPNANITISILLVLVSKYSILLQNYPVSQREFVVSLIKNAIHHQLEDLSQLSNDADKSKKLQNKSAGPFKVALLYPHLKHHDDKELLVVNELGDVMGATFGWIDDLVDWEEDKATNKITNLNLFLSCDLIDKDLIELNKEALESELIYQINNLKEILHYYEMTGFIKPLDWVISDWLHPLYAEMIASRK